MKSSATIQVYKWPDQKPEKQHYIFPLKRREPATVMGRDHYRVDGVGYKFEKDELWADLDSLEFLLNKEDEAEGESTAR